MLSQCTRAPMCGKNCTNYYVNIKSYQSVNTKLPKSLRLANKLINPMIKKSKYSNTNKIKLSMKLEK